MVNYLVSEKMGSQPRNRDFQNIQSPCDREDNSHITSITFTAFKNTIIRILQLPSPLQLSPVYLSQLVHLALVSQMHFPPHLSLDAFDFWPHAEPVLSPSALPESYKFNQN
jgi:hypothetical protein